MKKKRILELFILLLLGISSSFSLPPFNFFWINFISFTIFFIFLFKKLNDQFGKKKFFFYGWIFGFGYFLSSLYWITISLTFDQNHNYLIPVALILVPAFLALFYGLITLVFYLFNFKNIISSFFLFSLLFGLIEFIRGNILTGFPWNLIIYSFSKNINFLSFLSIVGTYSFNLLIISIFTAPSLFILKKSKNEMIACISIIIFMPIIFFSYSSFHKKNYLSKQIKKNSYTIRVVGSNISLDRFQNNDETEIIIDELIKLSSPNKNKKIFFVWPEGIISNAYEDELHLYKNLFSKNFNENHLIGLGITSRKFSENKKEYFNSFSIFDNSLNLIDNYNKINLVPFGEFLPFENFLNKVGLRTITNTLGSFTKGKNRRIIEIKNKTDQINFLPLICYEIIYTGKLTKKYNFNLILNISEDGWFGKSIGPEQHFAHSIFRAIETGKYVIRSANNGKTAIINPLGQVEKKIDYSESGFIDFEKRRDLDPTIFSIYGNKIFFILILLYIFLIFSFNRLKNE